MTFYGALIHILNFILPAVFVGGLLAVFAPLILRIKTNRTRQQVMRQWLINAICGIAALALGLWFYGVDGKMMSYTALVLVCGASQFVQLRAWRK
jgi:hypothetical protein